MEQTYYSKLRVMLLTLQFKHLFNKTFLNLALIVLVFTSEYVKAQCPSPAATTTIASSISFGGSTTTIPNSGTVTYVNGNVTFGTSILAYTITISGGTTWVVSAGSHLAVQNLNVLGTLIIQEGATVSVGSVMPTAIGSFNVNSGGIVRMCANSGVENCGSTTFAETSVPALTYVGAAGGKAVAVFGYKPPYYAGNLTMPYGGASNSSNITIVADNPPAVNYLFNIVGSPGASPLVYKGSTAIANLPFNTSLGCGGLFGQTADIDTDNDGIANSTDLDDDNDGILDTVENAQLQLI